MSNLLSFDPREALEAFQETHAELNTIEKIVSLSEDTFIQTYGRDFGDDARKARQVYREALRLQEQTVLLWANIKDAVMSPALRTALFNNIPNSFIEHQRSIPAYNQLFGNLDFIECDDCRSIFGPAAYFVDLLRFIEERIPQDKAPAAHALSDRQPRLAKIPLDCDSTFTLIPYIDLVNEVLEDIVRTNQASPYEVVETAAFPMSLPFHLPLEETRLYLKQLKVSLHEIYQRFGVTSPHITRELLALSPREYQTLEHPIRPADLKAFYNTDITQTGKGSIEDVNTFIIQTGLTRDQLNELLFLDLSDAEVTIGLSRSHFINNTGDRTGHLWIQPNVERERFRISNTNFIADLNNRKLPAAVRSEIVKLYPNLSKDADLKVLVDQKDEQWRVWDSPQDKTIILRGANRQSGTYTQLVAYDEPYDRLVNLTPAKLDRIYRFLKLSRKLDWSFADLDWALRSLQGGQGTTNVLRFDGINDFVEIPLPQTQSLNPTALTLEAWVMPASSGIQPIIAKGSVDGTVTQYLLWITPQGKLALFSNLANPSDPKWKTFIDVQGNYPVVDLERNGVPESIAAQLSQQSGVNLIGDRSLPTGVFSHVAVTLNEPYTPPGQAQVFQLKFYINGVLDSTWSLPQAIATLPSGVTATKICLGRSLQQDYFTGNITDVRLWNSVRSADEIAANRFKRLTGREPNLMAYWALIERPDLQVKDLAIQFTPVGINPPTQLLQHPGTLGGDSQSAIPVWVPQDLTLDLFLAPIASAAYHFNGRNESVSGTVQNLTLTTFTLEAWVTIAESRIHPLVTKGDPETEATQYQLWIDAANRLNLSNSSTSTAFVSTQALSRNVRTYVAAVVAPTKVTFYISEQPAGSLKRAETLSPAGDFTGTLSKLDIKADILYLGTNLAEQFLKGTLQEVRIWNIARNAAALSDTLTHQLVGTEAGLVGYWRLDEADPRTQPSRDRSIHQNTLYPGGSLVPYQPALIDHLEVILPDPMQAQSLALTFAVGHSPVLMQNVKRHGLGHFEQTTLELWFRATEPGVGDRKQLLFLQGDLETGLSIYLFANKLYVYAWCTGYGGTPIEQQATLDSDLQANEWHHLTFTYDETPKTGIAYRLYLDGQLVDQADDAFRLDQVGPIALGSIPPNTPTRFHDGPAGTTTHAFVGQISELRLWKTVLPESQITSPANAAHPRHTPPAVTDDLIAYLPLTEGYGRRVDDHAGPRYVEESDRGPTIPDQTANGHAGKLVVGPDAIAPKWQSANDLPVFPQTVLTLNGADQFIQLPSTAALNLVNRSFTLELWLRVETPAAMPILSGSPTDGTGTAMVLELTADNALQLTIAHAPLFTSNPLNAGEWHHLAWRYEHANQQHTFFLSGQVSGTPITAPGISSDLPLLLGMLPSASGQPTFLTGQISELRIWQTARIDADIVALWNQILPGQDTNLTAYWRFDQDPRTLISSRTAVAHLALLERADGSAIAPDAIDSKWLVAETPVNQQSVALALNGSDTFIQLPDYQVTSSGTIELWVNCAANRDQVLFDASRSAPLSFTLELRGGSLRFVVKDSRNAEVQGSLALTSALYDDRRWHFIAVTWQFDAQTTTVTTQLYLDHLPPIAGQLQSTSGTPSGVRPALNPLLFGRAQEVSAQPGFLQGALSEVRIWDRVRSIVFPNLPDLTLTGFEDELRTYLAINEANGLVLNNPARRPGGTLWVSSTEDVASKWVTGADGTAIAFNGSSDFIFLPEYGIRSTGTIELWAKFSRDRNQVLFDASNNEGERGEDKKFFILHVFDKKLRFEVEDDQDVEYLVEHSLTNPTFGDFDGQLHHVAATWQYTPSSRTVTLQLYLDGQLQTATRHVPSTGTPNGVLPKFKSLFVGINRDVHETVKHERAKNNPFQGQLRQFRLWQSVRTTTELQASQVVVLTGAEPGLLVVLPLNEAQGTRLINQVSWANAIVQVAAETASPWQLEPKQVLQLDGDALVLPPALKLTGSYTVEAWVNLPDVSGEHPILGTRGPIANQPSDELVLSIKDGLLHLQQQGQTLPPTQRLDAGKWYHLAWQYDAADKAARVFVNGVPDAAELTGVEPYAADRPLHLGTWHHWNDTSHTWEVQSFKGAIEEVRIWNVARTNEDIRHNLITRLAGDELGLVAYWVFAGDHHRSILANAGLAKGRSLIPPQVPQNTLFGAGQPPLYVPRTAPVLDGYNDYVALNQPLPTPDQPYTLEFWLAETPPTGTTRQWNHVAAVYPGNGANPRLFQNGQPADAAQTASLTTRLAALRLQTGHPTQWIAGQVADVRLWNAERTPQEIQANYQRSLTGREANLWSWWLLQDGSGDRLRDQTLTNLPPATLITGLENTAQKWQKQPIPLQGAVSALYFDGSDDRISLPALTALRLDQDFTVEAWVKLAEPNLPQLLPILGTIPPTSATPSTLCLGIEAGRPYFGLHPQSPLRADTPLDQGWHHLVWQVETVTKTNTLTLRMWVDGKKVAELAGFTPFQGTGEASIAHTQIWNSTANTLESHYFQGWISEVRIWRSLRTESEIRSNQDRPLAGSVAHLADLTAYWIFDEATQTLISSQATVAQNLYHLTFQSNPAQPSPIWETRTDYPVLQNPLPQQALAFDGELQFLGTDEFRFPTVFTFAAWVKVADLQADRPILWWSDRDDSSDPSVVLQITRGGQLELRTAATNSVATTQTIAPDRFVHIAVAVEAKASEADITLFLDGEESGNGTLNTALGAGDVTLQIGQSDAIDPPTYFKGQLQDLRLWRRILSASELNATRYHAPSVEADLMDAWTLSTLESVGEERYVPNLVSDRPKLRLGGSIERRKPTAGTLTTSSPFLDARRRVLTLPLPADTPKTLPIPAFATATHTNRDQRTIEIWFLCKNPLLAAPQTLYEEGDDDLTLRISIQSGTLSCFLGYPKPHPESDWQGSTLTSDRLQPNRWHHIAVVLDARAEPRDDAFVALLDGRMLGIQPAVQLTGQPKTITLGGLDFTLPTGQSPDPSPITRTDHLFTGQIKSVCIWETTRDLEDIRADRESTPATNAPNLLFYWDTETLPASLRSPLILPNPAESGISTPHLNLDDLAHTLQLQRDFDQKLDRLAVLWSDLKHTGSRTQPTLFDRIFNPPGTRVDEFWTYAQRLVWEVDSSDPVPSQIRSRLLSALRVSSPDLDQMVTAIAGGEPGRVILDGTYLTLLYRLRLLAMVLRHPMADLVRLMARLKTEANLNSLATFTLRDVQLLQERVEWMRSTGIDLSEYEFLAYGEQDRRVTLPYTDGTVLDTSTALLNQSREFLLTPQTLVSEDLSEAAASAIYQWLEGRKAIAKITLHLPAADSNKAEEQTLGVILDPSPTSLNDVLPLIATAMQWKTSFEAAPFTAAMLQTSGLINAQGMVLPLNYGDYNADALKALYLRHYPNSELPTDPVEQDSKLQLVRDHLIFNDRLEQAYLATYPDTESDRDKLTLVCDLLLRYKMLQETLPGLIRDRLQDMNRSLSAIIRTSLAAVLNTDPDRLSAAMDNTEGRTYKLGFIDFVKFLTAIDEIVQQQVVLPTSDLAIDLYQLNKILFLLSQFDLTPLEEEVLLKTPSVFGLLPDALLNPKQADLNQIYRFELLKAALSDRATVTAKTLVSVLQGITPVDEFTGWRRIDINDLKVPLNLTDTHTIAALDALNGVFQLVDTLGTNAPYLIDLANVQSLNFAFYQRHAGTLLGLVRAKYTDEQWQRVYKPIHDLLAIQKRDSLTAVAIENLTQALIKTKVAEEVATLIKDRTPTPTPQAIAALTLSLTSSVTLRLRGSITANLLYEYLLIDVQTGSEVDTSRIVQAIASLQLYVQRCLMNLERGVDPKLIPLDEWEWMKNYRVWEANRKVFLYPENYIEPELRDNKTNFFEDLESELQQGELTQDAAATAFNHYLDQFAKVANLTIVGSYLDTEPITEKTYALNFTQQNRVAIDAGSVTDIASVIPKDFTIELWLKPPGIYSGILSATSNPYTGWLLASTDEKRLAFFVRNADSSRLITTDIQPERWIHVAVTYNGSRLRMYVDGVTRVEQPLDGNIRYPDAASGARFVLGGIQLGSALDSVFTGQMREVRFWKVARTEQEIRDTMLSELPNPKQQTNLVRYWKMDEGTGTSLIDSSAAERNLSFSASGSGISWKSIQQYKVIRSQDIDTESTLYLIGRNEDTKEYYLRTLINGKFWQPWEKIDLSISAEFVSPVVAFNKLFLFWAEIQESVEAQDRMWVANNSRNKPVDQLGNEIVLRAPQPFIRRSGSSDELTFATIDPIDGGTLNLNTASPHYLKFTSKVNAIESINIPVKKPIVKYSYQNFSQEWTQPQVFNVLGPDFKKLDVKLKEWQQGEPKWLRVYAQRWRESDVAPLTQPDPKPIIPLQVAQLGPNSFTSRTLSSFRMDEIALSFWLRVNNLLPADTVDQPPTHTFSLLSYGNGQLEVSLTHTPVQNDEKLRVITAVEQGENAIAPMRAAIQAIQRFRTSPPTATRLELQNLLLPTASLTQRRSTTNGNITTMPTDSTLAKPLGQQVIGALDATIALVQHADPDSTNNPLRDANTPLTSQQAASLAGRAANVADAIFEVARQAAAIAGRPDSELSTARTHRDNARAAVDTFSGRPQDAFPQANQVADTALQSALNCLNEVGTVLAIAKANTSVWRRGALRLQLKLGSQPVQDIVSSVSYGVWQYVGLVLQYNDLGRKYVVTLSLFNADKAVSSFISSTDFSFATPELAQGSTLVLGKADNPTSSGTSAQYQPVMSEFRLWDFAQTPDQLAVDRFQRKLGDEGGLQVHFPLHRQESNTSQLTIADSDGLALEEIQPPIATNSSRERILLIYGGVAQTLRNTLKDTGFRYRFSPNNAAQGNYDLGLAEPATGAFVGIEKGSHIIVEEFAAGRIVPLDRFRPADRIAVINRKFPELSDKIQEWNANASNDKLLSNRDNGAQLEIEESYILDVHNQPGWAILDIGDEVFLVKINVSDRNNQQLRLQTAEERLRSDDTPSQTVGGGSGQVYNLYYERDRALEVSTGFTPQFEFTRMNTFAVQELSERLFGDGIDGLLSLETQNLTEKDFSKIVAPGAPQIIPPKRRPDGKLDNRIDFDGAYGLYYQEIFFHIPFLIANQLSANQNFAEAQKWYHYIFNPTAQETITDGNVNDRYWRYRPFRNLSLETLSELLTNEDALDAYRKDPFSPHAIARLRINTYQKRVVMKYIQNLLDWGDSLFRQDSREAITEAIQLYVLAFTLLGPRPRNKAPRSPEPIGSYEDLQTELNASSTTLPDFWVPQAVNPVVNGSAPPKLPFNPNRTVITRFGVPENAQLLGFWDAVEDRLFKIRHSLNIDGIFRSLALFQPPINPAELVAAVAAAGGTGNLGAAIASSNVPVPHYRFSFMLDKTKEMIGMVTDFGGALLDALEKVDGEALSLLQNKQELAILDSLTKTKLLQKEQQEINEAGLKISLTSAQNRQAYYQRLYDGDLISDEKVQIDLMISSTSLKAGATIAKYVASVTGGIPDITVGGSGIGGSPVVVAQTGGSSITKVSEALGAALDGTAGILDGTAAILGLQAGYERRRKEWEFQRNTANEDIQQIQLQIAAARNDIELAVHEIQLHEQAIAHTKEVGNFYRSKFSNKDLYNWMATRLSGLYFQAYRLAYDLAKQTERAFQFEFGTSDTFINFGYWDSRRRGLMAGEALRLDLARLEKSALDQDSRYLEITKIISLVRIDPLALLELRETGRCQFSLGELLFDRDFPGHYFRFIKSIALSIPAVVGPYQTIKATLTQTGHKTLMEPDISGVQYLLGEEPSMPGSIRVDWRVNQQIAISTAVEDSGVFELNFNDDRYLPFEGTGVVSNWLLEMPKATNAIDFDTITDVIIHLRYSCKVDNGSFRQEVMDLDAFRNYRGVRLFSIAQEFSAQWFAFKNTPANNTLELTLPPNTFPPNIKVDLNQHEISIVQIRSLTPSGDLPDVLDQFEIIPPNPDAQQYQFILKAKAGFDRSQIENLLVLLNYTGELLG